MNEPMDTAERVLELVRAAVPGAEAAVTVRHGNQALTRFANGFIHQNVAEEIAHVALQVAFDGHDADATADGSGDAVLQRLVATAVEAARARPADPGWPGPAAPEPAPQIDHWDDATGAATPEDRARCVRDFVTAAGDLQAAGSCRTQGETVAFANSAGQRLIGRASAAVLSGIARSGTSDGSARDASARLADLDAAALGQRARQKALDAAEPTDLDPGTYEVVLEPQCVANMLEFLFQYGFNGRAFEEGRSFVRLGELQFDPAITLVDDATEPLQLGVGFDAEGTPKRRVELVQAGVTSAVLHTRRTAARAGVRSTGHATEGGTALGALPSNVLLAAGDRPLDALVGAMARGLLVTDFWYTRILDPRTQVVTGLTRNGVWLVEDGRPVRPVRNLRFTQSFREALAPGSVLGVSAERARIVPDPGVAYLVPALRLGAWRFTGGVRS
ncbi:MAG: TldD/PmbA family protein [Candidatus Limnocylindrales bacterium]